MKPLLKQALTTANLSEDKVMKVVEACRNQPGLIAEDKGNLFDSFTKDDAAAVAMYTYDFGEENFESNPYRILNKSLTDRDYTKIQSINEILYLLMKVLRKLPRVRGKKHCTEGGERGS